MNNKCPKCGSENITHNITIPERTSDTVVASCNDCGYNILFKDWHGKSIFDEKKYEVVELFFSNEQIKNTIFQPIKKYFDDGYDLENIIPEIDGYTVRLRRVIKDE